MICMISNYKLRYQLPVLRSFRQPVLQEITQIGKNDSRRYSTMPDEIEGVLFNLTSESRLETTRGIEFSVEREIVGIADSMKSDDAIRLGLESLALTPEGHPDGAEKLAYLRSSAKRYAICAFSRFFLRGSRKAPSHQKSTNLRCSKCEIRA